MNRLKLAALWRQHLDLHQMADPDQFEAWAIGTGIYSPEEFAELTAAIVLWLAEPVSGGS